MPDSDEGEEYRRVQQIDAIGGAPQEEERARRQDPRHGGEESAMTMKSAEPPAVSQSIGHSSPRTCRLASSQKAGV